MSLDHSNLLPLYTMTLLLSDQTSWGLTQPAPRTSPDSPFASELVRTFGKRDVLLLHLVVNVSPGRWGMNLSGHSTGSWMGYGTGGAREEFALSQVVTQRFQGMRDSLLDPKGAPRAA